LSEGNSSMADQPDPNWFHILGSFIGGLGFLRGYDRARETISPKPDHTAELILAVREVSRTLSEDGAKTRATILEDGGKTRAAIHSTSAATQKDLQVIATSQARLDGQLSRPVQ